MYTLRKNINNIQKLIDAGKADEARRLVEDGLSQLPEDARREKTALFDILLYVEIYTENPRNALNVIERWSVVGFRTFSKRFSTSVLAAQLLIKTGQWFAARTELTELLKDPRSKKQDGLLDALSVYVDSDERCRRAMDTVLRQHLATAAEELGIPLRSSDKRADVSLAIRRAKGVLRASSRKYQELMLRTLNEATGNSGATLARDIRDRARKEEVGFFREQLRRMLHTIEGKRVPQRTGRSK